LAVIMTVLDTRRLWLASGEAVNVADGVFIVCADNTSGCGDDTGRYVDTAPLSAAFMDRFALRTEFSFLSPGREVQMLAARAGIHVAAARPMVEYAGLTRQQSDAGKLSIGVTPRRLIAWARAARAGIASAKAFNSTVIAGAAPEDRATLITIESVNLRSQHERIDAIVRGILDPDAPVATDPAAQGPVGPVGAAYPDDDTVR
jgi:MoxR-like ATPase